MAHPLFDKHQDTLRRALAAAQSRRFWNPYAEVSAGETADQGHEAIDAYRGAQFYLDQPGLIRRCGAEVSPFGLNLAISYPQCAPDALIAAARVAVTAWTRTGIDVRVGVCLEVLERLHQGGAELTQAIMHTTGQPQSLARSQGVVQALARGLESVAIAWREMSAVSTGAAWERSVGQQFARINKRFVVAPRGLALLHTCATAPTWMAYPALFASLSTGNPVIVKPHPSVILPMALTVAVLRQVLREAGFDANLVSLLVDEAESPVARELAVHPDIALIDCSGRWEFCDWLKEHARQAHVFSFSAATNCVVIDSTSDYKGMLNFLVASIAWYGGQMPTSLQNIFVPAEGLVCETGRVSPAQFGRDLAHALDKLLEDPLRAAEILGALQSPALVERLTQLNASENVIHPSRRIDHPRWPGARVHSPVLLSATPSDETRIAEREAGAVVHVVTVATSSAALAMAERMMRRHGGLDLLVYSTNENVLQLAEDAAIRAGTRLSVNLVGSMAQAMILSLPSAFSDLQGGGSNPASSATLVDGQFVTRRFSFIELRRAP